MIEFSRSVLLAPMAGVNDPIFRRICKQYGAELTYSEMISAAGLAHASVKSKDLLYIDEQDRPIAVQLFGKDPQLLAEQARLLEERFGPAIALIDINMGCPTRKIAGKGEGAALMKDPALAEAIIRSVVEAVNLPVTVKFRRGFEAGNETAVEFARMAETAGAAAIAVHGRWAVQMYSGSSDKQLIGRVKAAVSIPVIASGDVFGTDDIEYYFDDQGADAVMVARGAQGNPWIFGTKLVTPSTIMRVGVAREHLLGLAELFPYRLASMRKHIAWYFKGVSGASEIRRRVNECVSVDDYLYLLKRIEADTLELADEK
jgi:nifR3 family TIM-barrel protein